MVGENSNHIFIVILFIMPVFLVTYSIYIALLLGILVGSLMIFRLSKDHAFYYVLILSVLFSFFSLISVLLFASFEEIIISHSFHFGSISTYGLYLFCPFLIYLNFRKKDLRETFDLYSIYVCPSMIFQRIRCIIAGCCYGKTFFNTGYKWPTRELEIIFYLFTLAFFYKKINSEKHIKGTLFPLLMIMYGVFRFIIEFARFGSGLIRLVHLWSIISIIIGYSILVELSNQKRKI